MSYIRLFFSPIPPDRAYKGYEWAAVGTVLGLALLSGGCTGDEIDAKRKNLLPPTSASIQTARNLEKEYPGLRAFVSQTTGELLWIDSGRTPLTPPSDPLNSQTALAAVRKWLSTHPDTYRISAPQTALDSLPGAYDPLSRTLRFEQYQKGIPVQGKYGLARFSPRGELISLVTRLLPDQNFQTQASPAAVQAGRIAVQSWGGPTLLGGPSSGTPSVSPRVWRASPIAPDGSASYRLVRTVIERDGIQVTRKVLDPESGETLESWDETPSELVTPPANWATSGKSGRYAAPDSLNRPQSIPSLLADHVLTLAFSVPGVHALGEANSIADAGQTGLRHDLVPSVPVGTLAADWSQEPAYLAHLKAASQLALHLETTQRWFLENLGRASWDGEGGGVLAAVRGNRDKDGKPQFNAWGSGGRILVGDGVSPNGQFATDALDIVAHEFTHSVIGTTAGFEYHDEVGALNEALADFFGKSVQGFGDPIVGHDAGAYLRDILKPAECQAPTGQPDCRQPARYGEMLSLPLDQDNGGVHVNSAIISLPLARAAGRVGVVPVARLVHDHLEHGRMSAETNLEEYAAALSAHCEGGGPDQNPVCAELETRFTEGELLRQI